MPAESTNPQAVEAEVARQLLTNMENLNKSLGDIRGEVDKLKTLGDDIEELKSLDVENVIGEFEKQKARFEQVASILRNHRGVGYVPGMEDYTEQFSMLRTMIAVRTGNWENAGLEQEMLKQSREKASQIIDLDKRGGFFVPDQTIPEVIAAIYMASVFVNITGDPGDTQRVRVLDGLAGETVKIPKFLGGLIAYWIGEEDSYIESMTEVGDVNMRARKMGIFVRITEEMRRFSSFGFEALLRQDMVRAAAKKLDWTIAYGRGTDNMPLGFFHHPNVKVYSAQTGDLVDRANPPAFAAGDDLAFDGLDNMQGAIEDDSFNLDESAAFVSHPKYWRCLKRIKTPNFSGQTTQMPYLLGSPRISDAALADMIGPFAKSLHFPSTNYPGQTLGWTPTGGATQTHTDIAFGNWSDVILARWGGIDIEDDAGRGKGFPSDHIYMKLRMFADIGYRHPESIVVCPDAEVCPVGGASYGT